MEEFAVAREQINAVLDFAAKILQAPSGVSTPPRIDRRASTVTSGAAFHTLKVMEAHFTPALQAKLESVASENRRGTDEFVQELVENYLDHDSWFRQKVTASLGRLDRGEFLTHEEIGAQL